MRTALVALLLLAPSAALASNFGIAVEMNEWRAEQAYQESKRLEGLKAMQRPPASPEATRRWRERCKPTIRKDDLGVEWFQYAAPGCESGPTP